MRLDREKWQDDVAWRPAARDAGTEGGNVPAGGARSTHFLDTADSSRQSVSLGTFGAGSG